MTSALVRGLLPAQFSRVEAKCGLLATLLVIGFYNFLFFRSYFPITEGWFQSYADLMSQGKMPYRDFFFFLTPLYPLTIEALFHVIGHNIFAFRLFGVGLILALSSILYLSFLEFASAAGAFIIAVVIVIYYQSGVAHITYDFIQFVTLFACLGTYFLIRANAIEEECQKWGRSISLIFLICAGICGSLVFLFKQSNGLLICVFGFLAYALTFLPQRRKTEWLKGLLFLCFGFLVPLLLTALWLLYNQALKTGYEHFYGGALKSKGSLHQALFNWWIAFFNDFRPIYYFKKLWFIPLALGYFWPLRSPAFGGNPQREIENKSRLWKLVGKTELLTLALLCLSIVAMAYWVPHRNTRLFNYGRALLPHIATGSLVFTLLGLLVVTFRDRQKKRVLPLYCLSVGLIWGSGTSGGLAEAGVFLGLGLLMLWMLESRSFFHIGRGICFVFGLSLITLFVKLKFDLPYDWWGLHQTNVRLPRVPLEQERVKGMMVLPSERDMISTIVETAQHHSGQGLYSYPHIPLFYYLSGQWPPSKAIVQWFDFLPDDLAAQEAERLQTSSPAVIVFVRVPEGVYEAHETLFRNGTPSKQREIVRVLDDKFRSGLYRLEKSYDLPKDYRVELWTKAQ